MASAPALTVHVLASAVFEAWCLRCLNTTPWARVYMRVGTDAIVLRCCGICGNEEAAS